MKTKQLDTPIKPKGKGGRPRGTKNKTTSETLQSWLWVANQAGKKDIAKIAQRARGERKLLLDWMIKNPIEFTKELVKRRVAKPTEVQQDISMTVKWSDSDTKYGSGPI